MKQIYTSTGGVCPFRLGRCGVCIEALKGEGKPRSKKQIDEKTRDGERGRCVCVDRKQKDV
jgi:hypothetical protein